MNSLGPVIGHIFVKFELTFSASVDKQFKICVALKLRNAVEYPKKSIIGVDLSFTLITHELGTHNS